MNRASWRISKCLYTFVLLVSSRRERSSGCTSFVIAISIIFNLISSLNALII